MYINAEFSSISEIEFTLLTFNTIRFIKSFKHGDNLKICILLSTYDREHNKILESPSI